MLYLNKHENYLAAWEYASIFQLLCWYVRTSMFCQVGGLGLVVPFLQGQVVTVVQTSGTLAMLTDAPEKNAIGEETKAKTKEVSTRQQTTQKSKKEKTQNIKKKT